MCITLAVIFCAGGPAYQGWAQAASATPGPDPAFGSKKNSFQFSAGITYSLK
jgi:hypothetical protein